MTNLIGILVVVGAALLTWRWPKLSLVLMVAISPFPNIVALTGFDVRIVWIFLLTIHAFLEWLRHADRSDYLRPMGLACWLVLVLLVVLVLRIRVVEISADEVPLAESLLKYFVAAGCAALSIVILLRSRSDLPQVIVALSVGYLGVCGYGLWQAASTYTTGNAERVGSVFGNANYLAGYAGVVAMTAIMAHADAGPRLKLLLKGVALVGITCVALTLSRTGMVAVLLGVAVSWSTQRGFAWRRLAVALSVVVLLGIVVVTVVLKDLREQLTFAADAELSEVANFAQQQEDLTRLEAGQFALTLVQKYPFLGAGFGTFAARNYDAQGFYVVTHNTLLEVVTSMGGVGAVLLGAILTSLVRKINRAQFLKLLPVLLCFCVNALTADYLQTMEMSVVLAIAYVVAREAMPGRVVESTL